MIQCKERKRVWRDLAFWRISILPVLCTASILARLDMNILSTLTRGSSEHDN